MGRKNLEKLVSVKDDEFVPVLCAGAYFFCVLCSYFMLRPLREAMGVEGGWWNLYPLFGATLVVMVFANIGYAWLVTNFERRIFVPIAYGVFALCLVAFFAARSFLIDEASTATGYVFYVWLSVFNLFSTCIFWSVMADRFTLEQSKRLFPVIGVGGTLGAIVGAAVAATLASRLGGVWLMLVSVAFLGGAVACFFVIVRPTRVSKPRRCAECDYEMTGLDDASVCPECGGGTFIPAQTIPDPTPRPATSIWSGLKHATSSPYLLGVSGYVLFLAISSTLLYFIQARIVYDSAVSTDQRAATFATIDLFAQLATLACQLFVTSRLIKRLGVGVTLTILPAITAIGLGALAIVPAGALLTTLIVVQVAHRSGRYAIARPARETLFTVLPTDDKYKAKSFIDTFVYRAGDVFGMVGDLALTKLAAIVGMTAIASTAGVALPVALLWGALGVSLGVMQRRRATSGPTPPAAG